MEAIGLAASVYSLVELGKKLYDVARTLVGKFPDTDPSTVNVASTIVRDLQALHDCLTTDAEQVNGDTGQELRDACSELELSLAGCLEKCLLLQAGIDSFRQRVMNFLLGKTSADVLKGLQYISSAVTDLKGRFSLKGLIRIELAVTRATALNEQFREETNQRLDFIEEHLKLQIAKAEIDPHYAASLVGIPRMSGTTMKSSLERASEDLKQSNSGVDSQYLRVKIEALQDALRSLPTSCIGVETNCTTAMSGTTHQYAVDNPANQIEDIILQTITLVRALRSPGKIPFLRVIRGLEDLCRKMLDLGMYEDSRQTYSQIIRMYRAVRKEEDPPSEIAARLARAIIGLCVALSRLGRTDDAFKHIHEALDILRNLFRQDAAYKASLSVALNNMANYCRDANQHSLALSTINEAIRLREELVLTMPETYKADLAASILNASTCYSKLPYLDEEALKVATRAVCLAEELSREHPGKFAALLGAALHNRANRHLARWQSPAAYEDIKKAVEIRRTLATLRPDVYRAGLIRSLTIAKFLARDCQDGDAESALRDELQSLCKLGGPDYSDIAVNAAPQMIQCPQVGGRDRTKIRYHGSDNVASPFLLATVTTYIDQIMSSTDPGRSDAGPCAGLSYPIQSYSSLISNGAVLDHGDPLQEMRSSTGVSLEQGIDIPFEIAVHQREREYDHEYDHFERRETAGLSREVRAATDKVSI